MKKLTKTQVKKIIRDTGKWAGYIVPCKVNTFHIVGGWGLGMKVEFTDLEEMEKTLNSFTYYNCNSELGNYVAFYQ